VCRPFDRTGQGFVPGLAGGCVVLESADAAEARGRRPRVAVAGGAMTLDANSRLDPSAAGEARAIRAALADADLAPERVDYVNTHGTGSELGDVAELRALDLAFGAHALRLRLNATKGLTGHCLSSAGVIECIATAIQLEQGFLHPNPKLDEPISDRHRFVGRAAETCAAEVAISNNFAFGGINTAVVLVERGLVA
jgi:malonyl-ACP decarboxylase